MRVKRGNVEGVVPRDAHPPADGESVQERENVIPVILHYAPQPVVQRE